VEERVREKTRKKENGRVNKQDGKTPFKGHQNCSFSQ
jgi:hypothetical protein